MKINDKKISDNSKKTQTQGCQNCQIIRFFLLSVIIIILIGLIKSDELHHLKFVTPWNAAFFIIALGVIIFLIKLVNYFLTNDKKN